MKQLMTVDDLAKFLGYSPGHIRNLVWKEEIPHIRLSKKAIRFKRDEIEKWMEERNEAVKSA